MSSTEDGSSLVLVTDAYWRKTISVVRSLGRAGAKVHTSDPRWFAPAGFSRYCSRRWRSPDPRKDAGGFVQWVVERLRTTPHSLVIPSEEISCLALARCRDSLPPGAWVPVPPLDILEASADKLSALQRAEAVGIPVPTTRLFDGDLPLDVGTWMLKPRRGTGAYGVRRLPPDGLPRREVERLEQRFGPLLLQRFVPGRRNGFGISLLYGPDHECRASFVHHKIREFPVSGGVSTCAESVRKPEWVQLARRYVEGAGPCAPLPWEGVINLEFKVCGITGTPYLIEVNPRLWGSLPLAVASGVDFPTLMWRLAQGETVDPVFEYREGVRLRWAIYGELGHGLTRLKAGDVPWDVLGEESDGDFLWDADDPRPFWACLAAWGLAVLSPNQWAWMRR